MQAMRAETSVRSAYFLAAGILLAGVRAASAEPESPDTAAARETAAREAAGTVPVGTPLGLIVEPPDRATPLMVLSQLEQGWLAASPEMVIGCLSVNEVEIAIDRAGPPAGRYTRAQAQFLIRDLLHYGETLDFRITRLEWKDESPRAEAEWKHRMGVTEKTVPVDIELAAEAQGWRVVRIKSR
jgi:hypothetical protein